jgi:plasmid stabilization system protein ParE
MAGFRLSIEAEEELDAIWLYVSRESGSVDIATRVVDNIAERFWLLARYPYTGIRISEGREMKTCAPACAVLRQATMSSSTASRRMNSS